jgi:fido (protein-threonine AMPylation protein)
LLQAKGLAGPGTVLHFARLTTAVQFGHLVAELRGSYAKYPDSEDDFLELLRQLHRLAFSHAQLPFGGVFRQGDDRVWFGQGTNELEGAPPSDIVPRLRRLYGRVFHDLERIDRVRFAQNCAIFLEEFFRIHPFPDGNGRLGRLFLKVAANGTKRFGFIPFRSAPPDGRNGRAERRAYLTALEYAHRHCFGSEKRRVDVADPYRFLARWLDRYIIERDSESVVESASPSLPTLEPFHESDVDDD